MGGYGGAGVEEFACYQGGKVDVESFAESVVVGEACGFGVSGAKCEYLMSSIDCAIVHE